MELSVRMIFQTIILSFVAQSSLGWMNLRDRELHLKFDGRVWLEILVMSAWESGWIIGIIRPGPCGLPGTEVLKAGAYLIFGGILTALCIMDEQTFRIYDVFVGVAALMGLALGAMCFMERGWESGRGLWGMVFYGCLQYGLFTRWYGRGDGHAFLLCAIWIFLHGGGVLEYLLHMGAAFGLLAIVQGMRRNIGRRGDLKRPVAFLPYICTTVWFFL